MKNKLEEAFEILKEEFNDEEYLWARQCNLAVPFMDEGWTYQQDNKAAARIIYNFFNIDVTSLQNFKDLQEVCGESDLIFITSGDLNGNV